MNRDLLLSILAMDSYNRGYGAGLNGLNETGFIGGASIRPFSENEQAGWQNTGFYAIAYQLNGQKIISYRGTNFELEGGRESELAKDAFNGWKLGAGFSSAAQAQQALAFYNAVMGQQDVYAVRASGVPEPVLVGHSLGGGLAGFVGSLARVEARGYDHMTFGQGAWMQALSDSFRAACGKYQLNPLVVEATLTPTTLLTTAIKVGLSVLDFLGEWDRQLAARTPMISRTSGWSTDGEVLEYLRNGTIPLALGGLSAAALTVLNLGGLGAVLAAAGANIAAGAILFESQKPQYELDVYGAALDPLARHSMAMHVALQYADTEWFKHVGQGRSSIRWRETAPFLLPALIQSGDIAEELGLEKDVTGGYDAASQMAAIIAYSAIDEGEAGGKPFGDVGMRALFDDATDLGELLKLQRDNPAIVPASLTEDVKNQLSRLIVEFAGFQASKKALLSGNPNAAKGALAYELATSGSFLIDLRKPTWKVGDQEYQPLVKRQLLDAFLRSSEVDASYSAVADWYGRYAQPRNTDSLDEDLDEIVLSLAQGKFANPRDANGVALQIGSKIGDTATFNGNVNFAVGGGGDDVLNGSSNTDMFIGGSGIDNLYGNGGNDRLQGGADQDNLQGGAGDDFLIAEMDGASDVLNGGAETDTVVYTTKLASTISLSAPTTPIGTGGTRGPLEFGININVKYYSIGVAAYGLDQLTSIEKVAIEGSDYNDDFYIYNNGIGVDTQNINYVNLDDGVDRIDLSLWSAANPVFVDLELENVRWTDTAANNLQRNLRVLNAENVTGGAGNDTLRGNTSDNHLVGGAGNDLLFGGAGEDFLEGGAGNDTIDLGLANVTAGQMLVVGVHDSTDPNDRTAFEYTTNFGTLAADTDRGIEVERMSLTAYSDQVRIANLGDPYGLRPLAGLVVDLGRSDKGRTSNLARFGDDVIDLSTANRTVTKSGLLGSTVTANSVGFRVDLRNAANQSIQYLLDWGGWSRERSAVLATFANANSVAGGNGDDEIILASGKRGSGEGYSTGYGGAGNDFLAGMGWESHLYGGTGADKVLVGANTIFEDAQKGIQDTVNQIGDTVENVGIRLYGGVSQWWMEAGYATWAGITPFLSASPFGGALMLMGAIINDTPMMKFARYKQDAEGTLQITLGWGQAGVAGIRNYDMDLETGRGSGGIAVFGVGRKSIEKGGASLGTYERWVNNVLKAARGYGMNGVDPLVLDLDGDGFELSALSNSRVHFDYDQNGYAKKTGWVFGGDGFLVRDVNANGKIDNLTEMFGNATTGGFQALGTFDANRDGVISATDSVFAQLKVWVDANADGVTDTGELKTLGELGIVSISLAHVAPASALQVEGNNVARTSTFRLANGQTRAIGDVAFAVSAVDTKYLGNATVSAAAAALPELKGFGRVKDLRVAMTQDSALRSQVTAFTSMATTNIASLKAAAESILYAWAGVGGVAATAIGTNGFDRRKLAFLEMFSGIELLPRDASGNLVISALGSVEQQWKDHLSRLTLRLVVQGPMAAQFAEVKYNADWDLLVAQGPTALADILRRVLVSLPTSSQAAAAAALSGWAPVLSGLTESMVRADNNVVRADFLFAQLLRALDGVMTPLSLADVAAALGVQNLQIGSIGNDVQSRTREGTSIYFSGGGTDTITGGTGQDVIVFGRKVGNVTIGDSEAYENGDRIRFAFLSAADVRMTRDGNDLLIVVKATGETVRVLGQFAPVLAITSGVLASPNRGVEDIQFADGTIMEVPEIMTAVGTGTDGNDHMVGTMHSDVFIGAKGNDLLEGGDDADLYVIRAGDGQDVVSDQQTTPLLRAVDMMVFGDGLAPEDLGFARDGDDLVIATGGTNNVRIKNQFAYGVLGYNAKLALNTRVEAFAFKEYADSWTSREVQQLLIEKDTTGGNDTTRGFGDDDFFDKSAGNDVLIGLDGQDTYRWGKGAGNDTIDERALYVDINVGMSGLTLGLSADTIEFDESVSLDGLLFARSTSAPDLTITIKDTGETLTVKDQFAGIQTGPLGAQWFNRIEWFKLANGAVLSWQDVLLKVTTGGAGNDSLYGDLWQDTLSGGLGNDYLSGGGYGDTYRFNLGGGQDVIEDANPYVLGGGFVQTDNDPDTLVLGPGISPGDIKFEHVGTDIKLLIGSGGDSVTLKGQDRYAQTGVFGAVSWDRIEAIRFDNGTVWTWEQLQQRVIQSQTTAGNDTAIGFTLEDIFAASAGNDILMGGDSSDIYRFGIGSGRDQVRDEVSNVLYSDDDTIELAAGITTANIRLARDGNDLVIRIAGNANDELKVVGQFENYVRFTFKQIEKFKFADGTIWTATDVQNRLLQSTLGNDVLVGYYTDDTLAGGKGNDTLKGGDGADTYVFNRGDGQDRIEESVQFVQIADDDILRFGATIAPANLIYTRDGEDLIISISGTSDSIRIVGEFSYDAWFTWRDVERFEFADGTFITKETIRQRVLAGTSGNDTITGFASDDTLDGGAGNDVLQGNDGSDTYRFGVGDGQDLIREGLYDGRLTEDDTLQMKPGVLPTDVTVTRVGDDAIFTLKSGDAVRVENHFVEGYNEFLSFYDVERVTFANGTIWDKAEIARRSLHPTEGDDILLGTRYAETINGLGGNDKIYAGDRSDIISGGSGNDEVYAGDGDDDITGGTGNDLLNGAGGNDIYRFARGDGQDIVRDYDDPFGGWGGNDAIVFGSGIAPADVTVTQGQSGNDLILSIVGSTDKITIDDALSNPDDRIEEVRFANGTIWTHDQLVQKASGASAGNDSIYGTYEAEVLSSGAGDDTIVARQGNDILIGGPGNDLLQGNGGDDVYRFARGDGQDTILDYFDWGSGSGGVDTVEFAAGIAPANIVVSQMASGAGLILRISGSTDSVTLGQSLSNSDQRIEQVKFADGTIWTHAQLVEKSMLANSGNDAFFGSYDGETLNGGAGNDTLNGGIGDDILIGGTGNDLLQGNSGADIYRFARGDGQDVVLDYNEGYGGWGGGPDVIEFAAGIAPANIVVSQMASGAGLILRISGSTDSVTLGQSLSNSDQRIEQVRFADGTIWTHAQLVEKSMLANSGNDVFYGSYDGETLNGGAGNDTLNGGIGDDILIGGTGNDLLQGNSGADIYRFARGDGQDVVLDYNEGYGGWGGGADVIEFAAGIAPANIVVSQMASGAGLILRISGSTDSVTLGQSLNNSDQRIEQVRFADGTIWTHAQLVEKSMLANSGNDAFFGSYDGETLNGGAGNDTLNGGIGDDILIGGTGNDLLQGNSGADIYRFARGDGQDVVFDYNEGYGGWGGGPDVIEFAAGIAPANIVVSQMASGAGLILRISGSTDSVTLGQSLSNSDQRIEQVRFADGTIWTHAQLVEKSMLANSGNDAFFGSYDGETVNGGAGNDTLNGGIGDDILIGGTGNDLLHGNSGADIYRFARGDGQDVVLDYNEGYGGWGGGADVIEFAAGIAPANIVVSQVASGAGLILRISGSTDSVTLGQSLNNSDQRIEQVRFADGTIWTHAQLVEKSMLANSGNDAFFGSYDGETLNGGAGNDTINGGNGDDILIGGTGNDLLQGNGGADIYRFARGDGQDVVLDYNEGYGGWGGGADVIEFAAGILPTDIVVSLGDSGRDIVLRIAGTNDKITIDNGMWGGDWRLENIKFANGTIWDFAALTSRFAAFTEDNDMLSGTANDDTIRGGGGNDQLSGLGGNDQLSGDEGDDILDGSLGNDILIGGEGNDTLRGGDGIDSFRFGGDVNGFDNVDGGAGSDTIAATAANTVIGLTAVTGVETISGGGFTNVIIRGSNGADVFNFASVVLTGITRVEGGPGNDTITAAATATTIQGDGGDDTLVGGAGADIFVFNGLSSGFDSITGGGGSDTIQAAANNTAIGLRSLATVETITANGFANVSIAGSSVADTLNFDGMTLTGIVRIGGGLGDDTMTGTSAADTIDGEGGNDIIVGGAGDDILSGGDGNDNFRYTGATNGFDAVNGNAGADTISALANSTIIGLRSVAGIEAVTAGSFTGVWILGSTTADVLNFTGATITGITKIDGGLGNDTITGSLSADTIQGSEGDDTLSGGDGNDVFQYVGTTGGFDVVDGGVGSDIISALANGTVIGLSAVNGVETISAGTFTGVSILGSANADILNFSATTLTSITKIDGGAGNDTITGSATADTILGSGGDDVLAGGGGNDIFQYAGTANGFDAVDGGAGTDTISALANSTVISLSSVTGVETISAGIFAGVTIAGSGNADTLNFSSVTLNAITAINAGFGNDVVTGSAAADAINGGDGNDTLSGGAGNDTLNGDNNDDRLIAGAGSDTINGGAGIDTVDYSAYTANVAVSLAVTTAQTVTTGDVDTISNVENLTGGAGADTLSGSALANVLNGGSGNDRLTGGAGNDTIIGGVGAIDIAVFAGLQASYTIATNAGVVTVKDNQSTTDGDDGTDTISGIERVEFKGGVQQSVTSPIVLNLDGNGVSLLHNAQTNVTFDWDQDGLADQTGWIRPGDAFLVCDRDGNGTVSGADELSFVDDKFAAKSDLDGLTAFDANGDNLLSSSDADFAKFIVWQDSNGNGRADSNEVRSLRDAGIASISLTGTAVNRSWTWGDNMTVNTGIFTKLDGTLGTFSDVALSYDSATPRAKPTRLRSDKFFDGGGRPRLERTLKWVDQGFDVEIVSADLLGTADEQGGIWDTYLPASDTDFGSKQTSQYLVEAMPEEFGELPTLADAWRSRFIEVPTEQIGNEYLPAYAEAKNQAGQLAQAMAAFGAVTAFDMGTLDKWDHLDQVQFGTVDLGHRGVAYGERFAIA